MQASRRHLRRRDPFSQKARSAHLPNRMVPSLGKWDLPKLTKVFMEPQSRNLMLIQARPKGIPLQIANSILVKNQITITQKSTWTQKSLKGIVMEEYATETVGQAVCWEEAKCKHRALHPTTCRLGSVESHLFRSHHWSNPRTLLLRRNSSCPRWITVEQPRASSVH